MAAVVNFVTGAVLFVFPESPRFLLVRGQETRAVEVLEWFTRYMNITKLVCLSTYRTITK